MLARSLLAALIGVGAFVRDAQPFVAAEDPALDLVGAWDGTVKGPVGPGIRVILRVSEGAGGGLKAELDSPDQEAFGLAIDEVSRTGDKVTVKAKGLRLLYEATLDASASEMKGTWNQGVPVSVTLKKVDPASLPKPTVLNVPAELKGLWEGSLKVQAGLELRLVLNVSEKDGKLKAVLDSPDQGANGILITAIALKEGVLTFESKPIMASFQGKVNAAGDAYEGHFTQVGRKMPLTLKKVSTVTEARRTQMPKPPFPYRVEEVAYQNAKDQITLAGTLTLPEGDGPFPAVLLITGSGPQDRDETLLGHKPFLVLADDLTRRGIAVLRVDDRGVGGSTGSIATSTSEDFARDVLAGVDYLKSRPEIDPKKIGLCGHSEGGLIAPIAAAQSDDVAFVVLMAGTGVTGADIIRLQSRVIAQAMGASERALQIQATILEKSFQILERQTELEKAREELTTYTNQMIADLSDEEKAALELGTGDDAALTAGLEQMLTPWFRFFLTYDPRPTLAKVRCPVLAINGELDLQVVPAQNLPEIERALRDGGNERVTIKLLPGLNHLFQQSKTGSPSEYAKIEETINPAALNAIGEWIVAQTRSD